MTSSEIGVHLLTRDTPTPHCVTNICTLMVSSLPTTCTCTCYIFEATSANINTLMASSLPNTCTCTCYIFEATSANIKIMDRYQIVTYSGVYWSHSVVWEYLYILSIHVCTPVSMLVIMEYDAMSLQWQVVLH